MLSINLRRVWPGLLWVVAGVTGIWSAASAPAAPAADFSLAVFSVDVTIPLHHRCMGILPTKSVKIVDRLYAHGFVLQGGERPIVLCAVDWCEIRNGAYDQWRDALAAAAGTTRQCVLVSSVHQHDAPVTDAGAARLLAEVGLPGELYDEAFHDDAVRRVAAALREGLSGARRVTHLGLGQARVDSVASNRRVVHPDGRVTFGRGSSSGGDPFCREQPEGLIDPWLKTISFWDGDVPVLALHAYATHPMSFYGRGEVTSDFVGLARERRQRDDPSIAQIYVSGCSGDVTAGKFNTGSLDDRHALVDRMYRAMVAAWENTRRTPLAQSVLRNTELELEFHPDPNLTEEALRTALDDTSRTVEQRILAAMGLSNRQRVAAGQPIDFPCLDLGPVQIVLFPGESFVGLQLMAQQMRPDSFVMSIGFGECWPGYVATDAAFQDGFHDNWQWVGPSSEQRIRTALQRVLPPDCSSAASEPVDPPAPYGPVPTERQLRWHAMEFYGFIHFTVNTFTDQEWGYGDEDPALFCPSDLDADQIVQTAQAGGMQGLILTAKHHDGFCLWPSAHTEHSVKHSPWRDGQGDVVRELSDACRRQGLRFGVYLSPWDRHHQDYGRPEYITYYRHQLRELLTDYGDIFTVWFDGANGGDGYYGGARETRQIDNRTYYDWQNTWQLVRELMPMAVMFSDVGPDFRWVGNERGIAGDPCWATLNVGDGVPGNAQSNLNQGDRPGTHWVPAECDVSIRPGWFYHAAQDDQVKSPQELLDIYFQSVGRGACLNLNLPPDRRGQIHEKDAKALRDFRRLRDDLFARNLAHQARCSASNVRGGHSVFAAERLLDGNRDTYWATDDQVTTPELVLDLESPVTIQVVSLREYLPLGQRVEAFAVDKWQDGQWVEFASGTSIGNLRLLRTEPTTTTRLRLRITQSPVCPALSEFGVY